MHRFHPKSEARTPVYDFRGAQWDKRQGPFMVTVKKLLGIEATSQGYKAKWGQDHQYMPSLWLSCQGIP